MSIFVAGLDLGQARDYSALVITEATGTKRGKASEEVLPFAELAVRHIERFQLGTKYQDVAREVEDRLRRTPAPRYFAVDATGVGSAVVEMLARLKPAEITITGGNAVCYGDRPNQFRVPKRDLVGGLSVALQNGVLKIAKGLPHAELLTQELLNFKASITEAGSDTYSAWREGVHDDLVLALAIAVWYADLIFHGREYQAEQAAELRQLNDLRDQARVRISRF